MLRFLFIHGRRAICLAVSLLILGISDPSLGSTPILNTPDLSHYRELYRLIIVFPGDTEKKAEFLSEWNSARVHARMSHRSLLIFQVVNPAVIDNLRMKLSPKESGFRVWLIGMNGHLLMTTDQDTEPEDLFAEIDALPGRKAEIHRYNNWLGGQRTEP